MDAVDSYIPTPERAVDKPFLMVGHRLGEFSPTRNYRGHGKHTERSTALK